MTPERVRSSFFICRDGLRWQFYAEGDRGSEGGWRLTERGAKRAARRRLRRARATTRGTADRP